MSALASSPSSTPVPRPIIISGPSGTGKSTLVTRLLTTYPSRFGFSISHTTRAPRGNEKDGVEYHFTTPEQFSANVEKGDFFIEHAQFGKNFYGTSWDAVRSVGDSGKVCLLDIEMEGVRQVRLKDAELRSRVVFVQPPDLETLEKRLRGRGTDSEESIQERLKKAGEEMDFAKSEKREGDGFVVNDDLEKAWIEFEKFCMAE